jgi:Holliday junction resolvase-like predicted endonuclease
MSININNFAGGRLKGSSQNKINTADIAKARQNTNNRGFAERLSIGTQGEMTVKEFLIKRGYNYIDCTRNSKMLSEAEIVAYEKAEIDLIIESKKDDKQKTVEVKTFTKEIEKADLCIKVSTQYIDKEQQAQRKSDAWLYRTKAEYLFFVCYKTKNIYSIKTSDLRAYIEDTNNKVNFETFLDDKDKNSKYDRYNKCAYVNAVDLINKGLLSKMTKHLK